MILLRFKIIFLPLARFFALAPNLKIAQYIKHSLIFKPSAEIKIYRVIHQKIRFQRALYA